MVTEYIKPHFTQVASSLSPLDHVFTIGILQTYVQVIEDLLGIGRNLAVLPSHTIGHTDHVPRRLG
jgi:hypothetical protein